jgi:predicted dehydrogenase
MPEYRVGVIGTGRIASTMEDESDVHPVSITGAFAAIPEARLVAGANRGAERLHAFGRRWGVAALYHDYREMLAREQLDIVVVATHPPLHAELVVAAAAAGVRGIFCEKPMALSLAECDTIINACERAGTILLVNCTRRWAGEFHAVKELVESSEVGRLLHIVAHCEGCKPTPEWVAETEGPLLHDGVHTFDILRFFAGDIASIQGTATRRLRRELRVEDTSYALIEFASGVDGVVITDELSEYARWDVELQCERAVVRLGWNPGLWRSVPMAFEAGRWWDLEPAPLPPPTWEEASIVRAARDLVACIEHGGRPRCSGEDGRAAVEAIMAVYESQRRDGARVRLPVGVGEPLLDVLRHEGRL